MAGEKLLRAGIVALLIAIGCYFAAQPAIYPADWARDLFRGLVPLFVAGYLVGSPSAKAAYVGLAVVGATVALTFAWVYFMTPHWPGFSYIPIPGMRQAGDTGVFPAGTNLFRVGLRLAPEAAVRAAILFFAGVATRGAVDAKQAAAAR